MRLHALRLAALAAAVSSSVPLSPALAQMPAPSLDPAAWANPRPASQANFPGGMGNFAFFPDKSTQVLPNDPVPGAGFQAGMWPVPVIDYSFSFAGPGAGTMKWVYQLGGPAHSGILPLGPNFGYRLPPMPDGTQMPLSASDFAADCNGPVFGYEYKWIGGTQLTKIDQHVCSIAVAPTLDAGTLMRALDQAGWTYTIAFPMDDPGNGRALLFWSSNPATGVISPIYQGFARIYNVKWQNQFAPRDIPICGANDRGCATSGNMHMPYSDSIGAYIASLPAPTRGSAMRGFQHGGGDWATGASLPYAVLIADPWVAEPPTPPTPPPPQVLVPLAPPPVPPPAGSANPTNSGGPGAASGAGTGTGTVHDEQGAAFQWEAYCRSPNPDGSKRPSGWVDNCLATRH